MTHKVPLLSEQAPHPHLIYQKSVESVLEVAKQLEGQQLYFAVEWDVLERQKVLDMKTVSFVPTGALRQAERDAFLSAQYQMEVTSHFGDEVTAKFVWCYVGSQKPGFMGEPEQKALHDQLGLIMLTEQNATRILAEHADESDELSVLLQAMNDRGIDVFAELAGKVNRTVYGMINEGVTAHDDGMLEMAGESMISLVRDLERVNSELASSLVGRMTTQLLKSMRGGWAKDLIKNPSESEQFTAFNTLRGAIELGVIERGSSAFNRIMDYGFIYRYDFGTVLLHEDLTRDPQLKSTNIYGGVNRENFVHDFMMSVLDGRLRSDDISGYSDVVRDMLQCESSARFNKPTIKSYTLFFGLIQRIDLDQAKATRERGALPQSQRTLNEVGRSFGRMLNAISNSEDPERAAQLTVLNQKCVEIVETVMVPQILRKTGSRALRHFMGPTPQAQFEQEVVREAFGNKSVALPDHVNDLL